MNAGCHTRPFILVDENQVNFLFDTPHLPNCSRNNLHKHDLSIGNTLLLWKYIVDFYKHKHPLWLQLAKKKIIDRDIYETPFGNMKEKFAVQVLSDTLSGALASFISFNQLPPEAKAICDFLEELDQIFYSLNSQHLQCDQGSSSISQWQFHSPRQPHTVKRRKITLNAILLLWEDFRQNFNSEHLLTRRLNQDPLENMYGMVRQQHGCNETPNPYHLVAGLKPIFKLRKMFQLSSGGNCEVDNATLLVESRPLPVSAAASHQHEPLPSIDADDLRLPDDLNQDIVQENILYHFVWYLVESFLKKASCQLCPNLLKAASAELTS